MTKEEIDSAHYLRQAWDIFTHHYYIAQADEPAGLLHITRPDPIIETRQAMSLKRYTLAGAVLAASEFMDAATRPQKHQPALQLLALALDLPISSAPDLATPWGTGYAARLCLAVSRWHNRAEDLRPRSTAAQAAIERALEIIKPASTGAGWWRDRHYLASLEAAL